MRALVIAPSVPYPPNQGQRLRTWHLMRALGRSADVTLLTWAPPGEGPVAALEEAVDEVGVLPLTPAPPSLPVRLGRRARFALGGRWPPYVRHMVTERSLASAGGVEGVARAVRERHLQRPFDVVVLEEEALVRLPLPALGVPVVQHRLNVFSEVVAADVPRFGSLWWLLRPLELRAWRRFDRHVGREARAVVATTPETARTLEQLLERPVVTVPNGVEMGPLPTAPSAGAHVIFVGWMAYPPNVDAARWFVEEIWPRVRPPRPPGSGPTFRIVGRDPAEAVTALSRPDVVVTGEVPDVSAACAGARVGVVPLRSGMGIKNKTLELMAMGLPVVATPVGAEGIDATRDDGLLVASDADELAALVTDLLHDGDRADRLGAAARAYTRRSFGWEAIGAQYCRVISDVVRSAETGAGPR